MVFESMKFDNLSGEEVTQTFYFNYKKKEVAELLEFGHLIEFPPPAGEKRLPLEEQLKMLSTSREESGLSNVENNKMAYVIFQGLILDAYGEKGDDNVSFVKNQRTRDYLKNHVAFDDIIFEFLENEKLAADFIEQCLPPRMTEFESTAWSQFKKYISQIQDNSVVLDQNLTFANTPVKKSDYVSKRLPYSLTPGDYSAWDELVGALYSVEERAKIEWIIGAIVSGDSKKIQKFGVFYGPPGSGKGTVMDIMHKLFDGYTTTFDAKQLGSSNAQFALEVFKNYPLVAIQGDGNLSRIADNARLNSIVAHEPMVMITSKGRVELGEEECILLDWADIDKVDLIIRPYHWNVNGRTGVKAYLKSIFVVIHEDYLELKYADVPVAELESAKPIHIEADQFHGDEDGEVFEAELVED